MQNTRPLRRLRSFKVTDFGTNRKPICDFLLANNTNFPPSFHRFQVMADTLQMFTVKGQRSKSQGQRLSSHRKVMYQ